MNHMKSGRKLGRNSSHRKAMFRNMCCSLLKHRQIKTTLAKAKELRTIVEPLITKARSDSLATRRLLFSRLREKAIVHELATVIGPYYEAQARPGGYLRLLKCGLRSGDCAPMAIVQLVESDQFVVPDVIKSEKPVTKKEAVSNKVDTKNEAVTEKVATKKETVTKKEAVTKKVATKKETVTKKVATKKKSMPKKEAPSTESDVSSEDK